MKKKIIFFIPSLGMGGAEKSLISLLSSFDFTKYDVDLMLLTENNPLIDYVPQEVNIYPLSRDYLIFTKGLIKSCILFIKKGKWKNCLNRILYSVQIKIYRKNITKAEQHSWKYLKPVLSFNKKEYTAAIGYLEKTSIYFAIDCIVAQKKIGFIRTDYRELKADIPFDTHYFDQLNYIVANGSFSAKVLNVQFPQFSNKIKVIKNIISTDNLFTLAKERGVERGNVDLLLLSIGRLVEIKGYDISLNVAKILKDKDINFKWWIIGEGQQREELQSTIKQLNLQENVILLGQIENPYPYLAKSDIYVQTSYFEGKSSTINEAKVFNKPIVTTNFDSIFEQITDGYNGFICEMKAENVAERIIKLYKDQELKELFMTNLKQEDLNTTTEVEKFYNLINE